MAQQLGFDLPSRTALGRDAFFEARSNMAALRMIEAWPEWSGRKLLLTGPEGSGKTHLTHVWAEMANAAIVQATDLMDVDIPALASCRCVAVEDVPCIAGNSAAETALFHLHNLVVAEGQALLLTGRAPVSNWNIGLPDLASRLQGTVTVALDPPDDILLSAVMVKLLADRQLTPKPNLIPYLLTRMNRSFADAIDIVAKLDAASLAEGKPITLRIAAQVLDKGADNP